MSQYSSYSVRLLEFAGLQGDEGSRRHFFFKSILFLAVRMDSNSQRSTHKGYNLVVILTAARMVIVEVRKRIYCIHSLKMNNKCLTL